MEEIKLKISGMTCKHCVEHVKKALESIKGVKKADVNLETAQAVIKAKDTNRTTLIKAIQDAGYDAE